MYLARTLTCLSAFVVCTALCAQRADTTAQAPPNTDLLRAGQLLMASSTFNKVGIWSFVLGAGASVVLALNEDIAPIVPITVASGTAAIGFTCLLFGEERKRDAGVALKWASKSGKFGF